MDLSRPALRTNAKHFSNFEFIFELLAENRKIFERIERQLDIDQSAICYLSMDSSRNAHFFKFR